MSSPSEPVETTCRSFWICDSPIFMIEPLPNCFSICASAAVRALVFWSSIEVWSRGMALELQSIADGLPEHCYETDRLGVAPGLIGSSHRTIVRCKHPSGLAGRTIAGRELIRVGRTITAWWLNK